MRRVVRVGHPMARVLIAVAVVAAGCSSGGSERSESAAATTVSGTPSTAATVVSDDPTSDPESSTQADASTDSTTTVSPAGDADAVPADDPAPPGSLGTTAACTDEGTHWYCVAPGVPVVPADHGRDEFWGRPVGFSPEVFCARDLPEMLCRETTVSLLVAMGEWGSYGPVEYWVMGIDEAPSVDLVHVNCERRAARGQQSLSGCLERNLEEKHGLLWYHELGARAVAEGRAREDACHCGRREWGIHWLTSSTPFGFTDHFSNISGTDVQTTQFHEFFHAVQHAHLSTTDHGTRFGDAMGPVWFKEGGADWMGHTAVRRLLADGTLPEVNVEGRDPFDVRQRMRWRMLDGVEVLAGCPGLTLGDVDYDHCGDAAYGLGSWGHAWLEHRFGSDVLLDVFYPALESLGWDGAFAHAYGITPAEFYAEFDRFLALDIEEQLAILPDLPTAGGADGAAEPEDDESPPPTTEPPPTTTSPPATTQPPTTDASETAKEYLQRIGLNEPKADPQHWYLFSETIPEDFIAQHAQIHDLLVDTVGGYDRYVHIVYNLDDPNTESLRALRELGVMGRGGELVTSIDQVHEIRSCLSAFWAFNRHDGRHQYSFCVNPNPLVPTPGEPEWAVNDRRNHGPVNYRYGIFHGWVHEYFHHYQRAHIFDRALAMPDDCCGLNDPVSAPAWWVEGSAIAFPHVFVKEHFDDLSWSREHGLTVANSTDTQLGGILRFRWEEILRTARREIVYGEDGECRGVGVDEEYRHTAKCSHPHWFLMNVYLAYLASWQTVWVDLLEDMWALGFEGSFVEHVGMTVDEFYESYNAFMRSGDPDDPPPDGFFPDRPLAELVDFWAVESG